MKPTSAWWIFKKVKDIRDWPRGIDWWDGPFTTKKKANQEFDKHYRAEGRSQDFIIAKVTITPQLLKRKARR